MGSSVMKALAEVVGEPCQLNKQQISSIAARSSTRHRGRTSSWGHDWTSHAADSGKVAYLVVKACACFFIHKVANLFLLNMVILLANGAYS
jgi:hypothetical protein